MGRMVTVMLEIETKLNELFEKAHELEKLLKPFEKEVDTVCAKPFKEMSVSDKIKLAKFIVRIQKKNDNHA